MELVEGETLAAAHGRFGDLPWAREILLQMARGLRALHEHGIVHRDLKPANVLLAGNVDGGTLVKIADFGISRLIALADGTEETISVDDPTAADPGLTRTGIVMGTPAYMPPELAFGAKDAPPSSDVWSYGVIAYELATGHFPFVELPVHAATRGAPIPAFAELPATLPAWLSSLITRCLATDPDARPTAPELERILTAA